MAPKGACQDSSSHVKRDLIGLLVRRVFGRESTMDEVLNSTISLRDKVNSYFMVSKLAKSQRKDLELCPGPRTVLLGSRRCCRWLCCQYHLPSLNSDAAQKIMNGLEVRLRHWMWRGRLKLSPEEGDYEDMKGGLLQGQIGLGVCVR